SIVEKLWGNEQIRAIWVGGSLANGSADKYSDIDLRIAVDEAQLEEWLKPNWGECTGLRSLGGTFAQFGPKSFLHHLVLEDGTILDFYVQSTCHRNEEPAILVLACRDNDFFEKLSG